MMKAFSLLILLLICISSVTYAEEDRWQYIVSPGELNPYHAYISGIKNCTKCHELISGVSEEKCLDCHELISKRMASYKGYHATLSKECLECHTEHKREIIKDFAHKDFDHNKALFTLSGKHQKTECEKCHLKKEKRTGQDRFTYLGLSTECAGCHDNIHKSAAMTKCSKCHSEDNWTKTSFDHNRQTRYELIGLHTKVLCEKCHARDKVSGRMQDFSIVGFESCLSCHKDTHKGSLSADCLTCHSMSGWKPSLFSHDQSKFRLKGAHIKTECKACHPGGKYSGLSYDKCSACHQKTLHNKMYEPCTSCHTEDAWNALKKGWEDNAGGHEGYNYQLEGAHKRLECAKCHLVKNSPSYFGMKYSNCIDCHRDEHNGQFEDKQCEACHVVEDFKSLTLDHEKAGFKLEQMHKNIKCEGCHMEKKYRQIPVDCESCHSDITGFYKGRFKGHSPVIPSPKFRLVKCEKCHETNRIDYKIDAPRCLACHEKPYDEFFIAWDEYMKKEVSLLDEKLKVLSECGKLSPEIHDRLKKQKEDIAFIEKNYHHNYQLAVKVMEEYKEILKTASKECHE